jgi:hypothetical protein
LLTWDLCEKESHVIQSYISRNIVLINTSVASHRVLQLNWQAFGKRRVSDNFRQCILWHPMGPHNSEPTRGTLPWKVHNSPSHAVLRGEHSARLWKDERTDVLRQTGIAPFGRWFGKYELKEEGQIKRVTCGIMSPRHMINKHNVFFLNLWCAPSLSKCASEMLTPAECLPCTRHKQEGQIKHVTYRHY